MNNIFDILFLSFCTNIVIFSVFTVTAFNSIQGLIALILTFLSTTFLFFWGAKCMYTLFSCRAVRVRPKHPVAGGGPWGACGGWANTYAGSVGGESD
jgi:hypothetical protein